MGPDSAADVRKMHLRIARFVFSLIVAVLLARKEIIALFNFFGGIAAAIIPKGNGDIQIVGMLIAYLTILCGLVLFCAAVTALVYWILGVLPIGFQFAVAALIVAGLAWSNGSLPGVKRTFRSEAPATAFSRNVSSDERNEIQKYAKDRIRTEWTGDLPGMRNAPKASMPMLPR
ncbi:MAG TPA: hypothetical protein VFC78_05045 [Tepidisphaeraceae bacterium]|nr:hypothetical protein [Tepidisphaeraceae bacterium]